MARAEPPKRPDGAPDYARKHLGIGWWTLLGFLALGIVLEALHGFKVGFYLNVSNSTRRLMWTLAHAHGALLGLVHIVFGLHLGRLEGAPGRWVAITSACLTSAIVLLPGGFFLGGLHTYGGDPGLGGLLVPLGGLVLLVGVLQAARHLGRRDDSRR